MKKNIKFTLPFQLLTILIFLLTPLNTLCVSQIYDDDTTKSIKSIHDIYFRDTDIHIDKKTLVLIDADNTLWEPCGISGIDDFGVIQLGSDQWFYAVANYFENQGNSQQAAIFETMRLDLIAKQITPMKFVEPYMLKFIKYLKNKGAYVMIITGRSERTLKRITLERLGQLGIDFSLCSILPSGYTTFKDVECPACCQNGVIFCSDNPKAVILHLVLREAAIKKGLEPTQIILLDDKLKHLESIRDYAYSRRIPFYGFRYGFLDEKVATYRCNPGLIPLIERSIAYLEAAKLIREAVVPTKVFKPDEYTVQDKLRQNNTKTPYRELLVMKA
jgi:hypothetical protein